MQIYFTKSCFTASSFQLCHNSKGPKNQELVQEVDPPPTAHLHSHTVKPEPQEVVLRSIMSGQINYSPSEKCTFFSSPIFPSSLLVFFSAFIVFISGPPERNSQGDKKLCYLRYLKMSCVQTQNELLLRLHRPQNSGKYSPAVFPEDLRYSCPQYPHNAFVEFPKWMKSRFIWTLLKSETYIFLISPWLYYFTV